jgi:hypothetical protein
MALSANVVWVVRTGGAETNGGGYDSTISGAGTDYSDQDAPQLSITDLTSTNSTTCTSVLSTFTSAMVGNILRLASGTGTTTGYYMVTTYVSASQITLDRVSGTYTAGVAKIGGAHISLKSHATAGTLGTPILTSPLAAGHTVNIRGAGGNPDYDYSGGYWTFVAGDTTSGVIKFIGIGTRPVIKVSGLLSYNTAYQHWENFQFNFMTSPPTYTTYGIVIGVSSHIFNVIVDVNGCDTNVFNGTAGIASTGTSIENVEVKNTGGTTAGTLYAFGAGTGYENASYRGVYIHDVRGGAFNFSAQSASLLRDVIIANCHNTTASIKIATATTQYINSLENVTIDNGAGDGIQTVALVLGNTIIRNCIISNHSQASKYGINITNGSATANELFVQSIVILEEVATLFSGVTIEP